VRQLTGGLSAPWCDGDVMLDELELHRANYMQTTVYMTKKM